MAQLVKNPPAVQETWVLFLGLEETLEKEMATHSSILAWEIPGKRTLPSYRRATVHGVTKESGMT